VRFGWRTATRLPPVSGHSPEHFADERFELEFTPMWLTLCTDDADSSLDAAERIN
jgi:hypothetical protein